MPCARVGITLVGVVLLFGAVFAGSYALAHQEHQHHAQAVLLGSERAAMAKIAAASHGASCQVTGVGTGQLSGILTVPALNLSAPVEQGTDDPELNVAVGHDAQSVWPGRGRSRRVPRPRRQLLRAPEPARAG